MIINKDPLEKLINRSIINMRMGIHEDEVFAIYEGHNVQVQIRITKNEDDWCDQIAPEYATL